VAARGVHRIAAAFAEAERDRIRERIGQVKADQKARGRYLGGTVPFGFRLGENGELVEHEAQQEAIRAMSGLKVVPAWRPQWALAPFLAKGHQISHEGVAGVLKSVITIICHSNQDTGGGRRRRHAASGASWWSADKARNMTLRGRWNDQRLALAE
jgi:hypothetical protein